jgi:hypothetical protein
MCTFSFCGDILLHKYHIDGKHVRVYHSRICHQTSFLAMANVYVNLTVRKRTRNKCIGSAETHFSFRQFTHKEYISMDATSLRKQ